MARERLLQTGPLTAARKSAGFFRLSNANASIAVTFPFGVAITGLTPGTAYWFDLNFGVSGGTGSLQSIGCKAVEY